MSRYALVLNCYYNLSKYNRLLLICLRLDCQQFVNNILKIQMPFKIYPSQGTVYCCCSTFNFAYCHHILAIRLELTNIIWDPTYMKLGEPRRLFLRKTNKVRPKQSKGKALVFEWNFFKIFINDLNNIFL
jgi:hypothetical protein